MTTSPVTQRQASQSAPAKASSQPHPAHQLTVRRLGVDTYREPVVFMRSDCVVCRSEGFEALSRVTVTVDGRSILATLNVVHGDLLAPHTAGLSEAAWLHLGAREGALATFSHAPPVESFARVRGKLYGARLSDDDLLAIIEDIAAHRYTDVQLSAFVSACAERLDDDEVVGLTRAMLATGDQLEWPAPVVVDKHCVGGLPGNRTTPIVVAIVAANGLVMPKTSSRAITSPAGTADTMEQLAPVDLDLPALRRVVADVGGCIAWGGSVQLSPADDVLIRVERALDIDTEGQLVASVLSKKAAAGSTHVLIDIPMGPTAKVRTPLDAARLERLLRRVGTALGLRVEVVVTDGRVPVGRGIGPALEAYDVIGVLQRATGAPDDLRARALILAGALLELGGAAASGGGLALAEQTLDSGAAWTRFQAICDAQGGIRLPGRAPHVEVVPAPHDGTVASFDNRELSRAAKLAGAPGAPTAGIRLRVSRGDSVELGAPLFEVHAESRGELRYALDYIAAHPGIIRVEPAPEAA